MIKTRLSRNRILSAALTGAAIICCICLLVILSGGKKAKTAEIYFYDKLLMTVDLGAGEQVFTFPEAPEVCIEVSADGEIYFKYSDCPDKICVKTGKLSQTGETAVCLPNGIIVKVVGDDNELDAVSG